MNTFFAVFSSASGLAKGTSAPIGRGMRVLESGMGTSASSVSAAGVGTFVVAIGTVLLAALLFSTSCVNSLLACSGDIELCFSRLLDFLLTPSADCFVLSRFSFLLDLSLEEEEDFSFAMVVVVSQWLGSLMW